ncbi:MAG: hypothetical protein MH825_12040 [Cyanobacteria bacterium]|nr:hypothetical protein [Cyanobacteriota bacterium]
MRQQLLGDGPWQGGRDRAVRVPAECPPNFEGAALGDGGRVIGARGLPSMHGGVTAREAHGRRGDDARGWQGGRSRPWCSSGDDPGKSGKFR